MATLRGETVDRPAVSFYELNGLDENAGDSDPFNIYNDPSWAPLIELARTKTDRIVIREIPFVDNLDNQARPSKQKPILGVPSNPLKNLTAARSYYDQNGSRYIESVIKAKKRVFTSLTRQDPDINTIWTVEHLLKNIDDLKAFLEVELPELTGEPDISVVLNAEEKLGDSGIVMIDTPDPLCLAAQLFDMETYMVIALTAPVLLHQLLDRFASILLAKTEIIARKLPGRLWRIYGPEYASPPYLPPTLFREYVVRYDKQMVDSIHRYGGYVRIHSHGNLHAILDDIVSIGCMALDPIEPPPQGDVDLSYVRRKYGKKLVLFGNLEITDIENLPSAEFSQKVYQAIEQGTFGAGRGFVLMPSASPYGRHLSDISLKNYEKMIEIVENI